MKKLLVLTALSLSVSLAFAAEGEFTLTIKNHVFEPKELKVPAGKKIKIVVINEDATPAEFESKPLNREKIIAAKSKVLINIGPLKAGRYAFVEEYHEKEPGAQGTIVAE